MLGHRLGNTHLQLSYEEFDAEEMASAEQKQEQEQPPASATYEAGCHCGYIKFAFTISPGLDEYKVMQCNCSGCTRFGYLLVCESVCFLCWMRTVEIPSPFFFLVFL